MTLRTGADDCPDEPHDGWGCITGLALLASGAVSGAVIGWAGWCMWELAKSLLRKWG